MASEQNLEQDSEQNDNVSPAIQQLLRATEDYLAREGHRFPPSSYVLPSHVVAEYTGAATFEAATLPPRSGYPSTNHPIDARDIEALSRLFVVTREEQVAGLLAENPDDVRPLVRQK